MSIGIEFKIPNEYGNYLKQILNNIDREDYMWNITEDEVYITQMGLQESMNMILYI